MTVAKKNQIGKASSTYSVFKLTLKKQQMVSTLVYRLIVSVLHGVMVIDTDKSKVHR